MAFIRDRTNLFISYRQSYTHHPYNDHGDRADNYEDPLIGGEAIEMESMPPQWIDITDKLDRAISQIQAEMAQLQPLHRKNALPGFDDRTAVDKEIEALTVAITRGLHRCQALVKAFGDVEKSQTEPHLARMAHNIQISMAAKLQDCSTMFRKMQSTYLKALQQDEIQDLPGFLSSNSAMNNNTTMEDDVLMSQQALERNTATFEDAEVAQREEGINRVADTILEVADIFRDLQTMVIDQGALIDRIDYNVEHTLYQVKGADQQLVQGERYQKRTQKCRVILLLSLIVFGMVLVLIFKPRHKVIYDHRPDPPPQQAPADGTSGAQDGGSR